MRSLIQVLKFSSLLLLMMSEMAFAWRPHSIIIFGDSLSDNGNKYQLYSIPISPPYWHGRYSNGPVWVENLAFQFNLIPNPLIEPDYPRHLGLQDYAMGDSTVLEKNQNPNVKTHSLLQQLKNYQSETHPDPSNTLAIIWDGANDFKSSTCQASPFSCTKEIIHTQVKVINTLYELGIRHFLIPSLPSLSIAPIAHEHYDVEQREVLRGMIRYYNNNLALAISQIQASQADIDIISFDV
ncbi:MAG TPA: SGNH/GDSL hydrolase family protein, partial [Coxiellaceae bacterium]|nr:SGNH/GDSL hydrolase family protein [Coxiellaceae bacterium]